MDKYLTELKQKFPNWDPSTEITKDNFINAGYYCVNWPDSGHNLVDFKKYIAAVSWCKDVLPDTSHCVADMFLFVDSNEATQFALRWI